MYISALRYTINPRMVLIRGFFYHLGLLVDVISAALR